MAFTISPPLHMAPEDGLEPSKRHAQTSGRDSPAFNFRHSGIDSDSE